MSSLEALTSFIYHEKQQPGSQLCAQHALNAILQGDFFSAPDLAQFAQQLDTLEGAINGDAGPVSNNMDDTGFFSVEVLERALRIWGFTLVRWQSEDLRGQQETPHTQMAFLLNHQQHWFSLRRFGRLEDPENGHWFNLNSFLPTPEWVGKLYLGMVLSQAENEGYSIFAVLPSFESSDGPKILPHTEADDVASTLPPPSSSNAGAHLSTTHVSEPVASRESAQVPGFEDEDLELQAALQASMMGNESEREYAALAASRSLTSRTSFDARRGTQEEFADETETHDLENHDLVAASVARSKAIMRRMLQEQEMAFREGYEDEVARGFGGSSDVGPSRENGALSHNRDAYHSRGEMEEDEALQRAIEESRRYEETQETMDISNDQDMPGHYPTSDSGGNGSRDAPSDVPRTAISAFGGSVDRVYDDEDSELQAALKASLEGIADGFHIPPPTHDAAPVNDVPCSRVEGPVESATEGEEDDEDEEKVTPLEEVDVAEIRKRRLARFGG